MTTAQQPPSPADDSDQTTTIHYLVPGGMGLGHVAAGTVFIPLTAPGDRVRFRVERRQRKVLHGVLEEVLEPGPGRCAPVCPLYGQCGGCDLQHLEPRRAREVKRRFVVDALERIGRFPHADKRVETLLAADPLWGYRRRVTLRVGWMSDHLQLGFFRARSHDVVDLAECSVLDPQLQAQLTPLRDFLALWRGARQVVSVQAAVGSNGVGLLFNCTRLPNRRGRQRLELWAVQQGLAGVWLKGGDDQVVLVTGEPLVEDSGGSALGFHPGDFIQAHAAQNRRLVAEVCAWAGAGARAWDLFCGVGNLSLPLAGAFARVTGVELSASSVSQARESAARAGLSTKLEFRQGDLFHPRGVEDLPLEEDDVVVLDPPRSGAEIVAARLARSTARRVVYVSCDPATLARDARILADGGWTLGRVLPLDLFPQTHHVETLALLERG
ncbi:MAG: methyltransferase domain-containing protein [Magnetococcus sp. WYHC-3]